MSPVYAGIDLAALPKNNTGVCMYDGESFECMTLRSDREIVDFILYKGPKVIAIDAPLTLPAGRCCFDDACCGPRKLRACDRMLIARGHRVFPPGFSFMKQLTLRGKSLKGQLGAFTVIEVHPRTSMRILGLTGFASARTEHERDACAAALTAFLFDAGQGEELGDEEGIVVIPRADAINRDDR